MRKTAFITMLTNHIQWLWKFGAAAEHHIEY